MVVRSLAVLFCLSLATPMAASTIYSNFSGLASDGIYPIPCDSSIPCGKIGFKGVPAMAQSFSFAGSDAFLDQLAVTVWPSAFDEHASFKLGIHSDDGAGPGALIEDSGLIYPASAASSSGGFAVLRWSSDLRPVLSAGQRYWVTVEVGFADLALWWVRSEQGDSPMVGSRGAGGLTWLDSPDGTPALSLEVDGTVPVPEPTGIVLLGSGLASLYATAKRRRVARRDS
jgi:hypothetical protein